MIRELSIDGNPVTLNADCSSFLIAYMPKLNVLSNTKINEQMRKSAQAWRLTKEQTNLTFFDFNRNIDRVDTSREKVISNAKINWDLLRSRSEYGFYK